MKTRPKFPTRKVLLRTWEQVRLLVNLIPNLPIDSENPLEIIIREPVKVRGLDQNAMMWAGPLADIAAQAWVCGRQYSAEIWHEQFKREYLPEEDAPDLGELVKDPFVWRKWDWMPNGDRVLTGSTTQLTKKGFSQYIEQIEAFGSSLGVQFSAR